MGMVLTYEELRAEIVRRADAAHARGEMTDEEVERWRQVKVGPDPDRPGVVVLVLPTIFKGLSFELSHVDNRPS